MQKEDLLNNFNHALNNLNQEQRSAVDNIEGPVMVIAGPGTGKTQILTLRIANILQKTDTKPENILALTFTDSGVTAMRNRLTSFIGSHSYQVNIHTFHSFSNELINRFPDSYHNIVGGRVASDLEKIFILESILEGKSFKRISPLNTKNFYVKPISSAIQTLKRENVSPDDFAVAIQKQEDALNGLEKFHLKGLHKGKIKGDYKEAEKNLEKNQELLYVYRQYTALMKESRLYDFEDMILDTVKALEENEEMRLSVQEEYQYILADEHQDVNQSQNALINIIANYHENPNVFVVGDEKQAIYRFQGASLENFLFFEDIYPRVKIISLVDNYRSGQEILDLAFEEIKTEDPKLKELRLPLKSKTESKTEIKQFEFSHISIENNWLAAKVKEQYAAGVPWSEQAIIVSKNKIVEQLSILLRKEGIPVWSSVKRDILRHPIFINLKTLIKAVTVLDNGTALAELLLRAPYLKLDGQDLIKVFSGRKSRENLLSVISNKDRLRELGVENEEPFLKISSLIKEVKDKEVTETPATVLEFLLKNSGFLEHVLENSVYDSVSVVRRLYDEVELMYWRKEATNLAGVLSRLDMIEEYELSLTAPSLNETKEAVNVITAHKAKGLEFTTVFLPHLTEKVWGGKGRADLFKLPITKILRDEKEQIEDDVRRLFYVALTRAKNNLFLSLSKQDEEGKDLIMSRFLSSLEAGIEKESTESFAENFSSLSFLETEKRPQIEVGFIKQALENKGWSATSLNNYLKSPWNYLYKNALSIPSLKSSSAKFGTAVHDVLQELVRLHFANGEINHTVIKELLEKELEKSILSTADLVKNHEQGFSYLVVYWEHLKSQLAQQAKTEYRIEAVLKTEIPDFPEVKLTGSFDRVDLTEDGQFLRVVDYKTGNPKTRNVLEGKTKNSDGDYKRQLVFYALLLSLQDNKELWTDRGIISFVKPDSNGRIKEEEFIITEEEISELKQQIKEATKDLISGRFLEKPCAEDEEFCFLRDLFQ